jgi:hypothetical protein
VTEPPRSRRRGDGHIPAVFWEVNPLETSSRQAHCWRQNFFAAKIIWKVPLEFAAIDSSTVTNARTCYTSIDLLRRKPKQGLSGYKQKQHRNACSF